MRIWETVSIKVQNYGNMGDSLGGRKSPIFLYTATLHVRCWPDSSNGKRGFSNQLLHKKQFSLHFQGMLLLVFLMRHGICSHFLFVLLRQRQRKQCIVYQLKTIYCQFVMFTIQHGISEHLPPTTQKPEALCVSRTECRL